MDIPEMIVLGGWASTHYHKPKWVLTKWSGKYRLATACGRDSAIYDLSIFEKEERYIKNKKPCKICYK
jgi:hypothetical protein